ncbi:MAG TPA: peptidoglycan DD-metalloendopeptidase family protein [Rhodothermales bacterium]
MSRIETYIFRNSCHEEAKGSQADRFYRVTPIAEVIGSGYQGGVMPEGRFYYYDEAQCTFVEVADRRSNSVRAILTVVVVSILLAAGMYWGLGDVFGSPELIALKAENQALRHQLSTTDDRIEGIRSELADFSDRDKELYRTILQAEPISDQVRQAGAGGTDVYADFQRFGSSTRSVLRQTAESLDRLERQMEIQGSSYRELIALARKRADELQELPAIMPSNGRLVSGYGVRLHPIDQVRRMHSGIDITTPRGTPVVATADGVISYSGRRGGYGITVEIKHRKSGYTTRYAHLSRIPETTRVGRYVERGELIAYSGSSGRSTAPHVHYEVLNASRRAINPIDFFAPGMTPDEFERLQHEAENAVSPLD